MIVVTVLTELLLPVGVADKASQVRLEQFIKPAMVEMVIHLQYQEVLLFMQVVEVVDFSILVQVVEMRVLAVLVVVVMEVIWWRDLRGLLIKVVVVVVVVILGMAAPAAQVS
jgi:hypothetical protein